MKTIAIISECKDQETKLIDIFSERYNVLNQNEITNCCPDVAIITAQAYAADVLAKHPEINTSLNGIPCLILWEYEDAYHLMAYRYCKAFTEYRTEKNASALLEGFAQVSSCVMQSTVIHSHLSDIQSDIHNMYHESHVKGIIEVEYQNFARIYQFVEKLIERSGKPMQTLLLSLIPHNHAKCTPKDLMYANEILSKSIQMTLRKNDVMTNYSDSQMLVLLVDADDAGGHFATNRIINTFFGLYEDEKYQIDYDIRPVGKKKR